MSPKTELVLLVLCYVCCTRPSEAVGKKLSKGISVKTLQTIYGDKYDCVDFYKQPAFDHPSLKNYSVNYDEMISEMKYKSFSNFSNMWINGKGCPIGKVPIRRITDEDHIRSKLLEDIYFAKNYRIQDRRGRYPDIEKVVLRTKDTGGKYLGSGMKASIWNPYKSDNVYSSAEMIIQNGRDRITVGWTVNPILYKDKRTRAFIYTNAGTSHCFNTQCPGFVITRSDIPPDSVVNPISKIGGPIYDLSLFVYKDIKNGNWYLNLGPNSATIGFWPSHIFTGLADAATHVEWGGEVYCPKGTACPAMGSGGFHLTENTYVSAYCSNIQVLDYNNNHISPKDTEVYTNDKVNCYAKDEGIVRGYGRLFFYGCPAE